MLVATHIAQTSDSPDYSDPLLHSSSRIFQPPCLLGLSPACSEPKSTSINFFQILVRYNTMVLDLVLFVSMATDSDESLASIG